MGFIRTRRAIMAGLLAGGIALAAPAQGEEQEIHPVACAVTYSQLNTLRTVALQPATITKGQYKEFEAYDFSAREAEMLKLAEADPDISQDDIDLVYSMVGTLSVGNYFSELGMDNELIIPTLKEGSRCDSHYGFSPDSAGLLVLSE